MQLPRKIKVLLAKTIANRSTRWASPDHHETWLLTGKTWEQLLKIYQTFSSFWFKICFVDMVETYKILVKVQPLLKMGIVHKGDFVEGGGQFQIWNNSVYIDNDFRTPCRGRKGPVNLVLRVHPSCLSWNWQLKFVSLEIYGKLTL